MFAIYTQLFSTQQAIIITIYLGLKTQNILKLDFIHEKWFTNSTFKVLLGEADSY